MNKEWPHPLPGETPAEYRERLTPEQRAHVEEARRPMSCPAAIRPPISVSATNLRSFLTQVLDLRRVTEILKHGRPIAWLVPCGRDGTVEPAILRALAEGTGTRTPITEEALESISGIKQ